MTIFTLPTWAEFLAGAQAWASGSFTEMLPTVWVSVGLAGAAFILLWLKDTIIAGLAYLFRDRNNDI